MDRLTLVFPGALVLFLLLIFIEYLPRLRAPGVFPRDARRWTRRDSVLAGGITLAYAIVAFLGLGNTAGARSYCRFERRDELTIELPEPSEISAVRYFSVLGTGEYQLEFSPDGRSWTEAGKLEQSYVEILKWNTAELAPERPAARYLRLRASDFLCLGELALFGPDGALLAPVSFDGQPDAPALFDEQERIPEKYDYRNSSYFDEIYHARTALEHIENVHPYEISHPPLGKLILSLGIRLFGLSPFGWRFSGTLTGVLMLPAMYLFLKKMFGGTAVPACCTTVFATDFMHYVQTRIATIDSYAVFFILLMYLFFWLYWEAPREKRGSWLPPLALSGLCFGLGAAAKWVCIYAGAGLGLLWLLDRIFRGIGQCRDGRKDAYIRETAENVLWCILFFIAVPALVYYVSYWPYGTARGMSGPGTLFSRDYLKLVLDNQSYMFSYHSGVTATHPYSSVWWQWLLDIRPILYYLDSDGAGGHVSFGAWVNPALCWGGLLALLCVLWRALRWRDRTALFIIVGYFAQLLPWLFVTRVVFAYHYFPSTVFLLLALGYVFRDMELNTGLRRGLWSFTGVSAALFALFYPALRGLPVADWFGRSFLKWMPTWPF
ncbi:MAG: phospholipid carrier-dependent glycosyltransferase [Oscillospiraceae bacterium]|nr:phospholipid carrier-dependent glycosyltransferase [Oscillospiraceae bacterium]